MGNRLTKIVTRGGDAGETEHDNQILQMLHVETLQG